jgi:exopolyphosphatase/guanosine-5'-triphosphate,3'-diphosphate pyrophosphatase
VTRRLATIDLGTNTVRVLVVEAERLSWRALYQAQRVTRLGEGQAAAGRLLDGPMHRTMEAVVEFVAAAERCGAGEVRVVATSAVREAANRDEFVARVRGATGHEVEVVSGEDEARLTLRGVTSGLPELGGDFVLFDIGGGSTEFVLARDGRPVTAVSLGVGVVRLAERFMDSRPVSAERLALLRRAVEARLDSELPPAIAAARAPALVGTAGTVTTLAALDLTLPAYDADRVQGHVLRRAAVEGLLVRLSAMTLAERARLPCMEPGRADVLIPGIAICLCVMERLGHASLVVSDRGLREGILEGMLAGFFDNGAAL